MNAGLRRMLITVFFLAQQVFAAPFLLSQQNATIDVPQPGKEAELERRVSELESSGLGVATDCCRYAGCAANALLGRLGSEHGPIALHDSDPGGRQSGSLRSETRPYKRLTPEDRSILDYFKTSTINVSVDGYYAYNFNNPIGRVNLLRAYDVSSIAFSLNQAAVVFERAVDPAAGRRWGTRLDLQFGQATATLQGNPNNEHRPDIYRNIFQAYGTYVAPVGSGINIDFGKWASSLGYEGNYTKDQMNYSRSYWFNFLPFYHMGFRVHYQANNKLGLNYWVVNGNNQTEPTNGFKDEMFGFVFTPNKKITWTTNYYLGQDNPMLYPSRPVDLHQCSQVCVLIR